jgi:hypothetical protein
MLDLNHPQTPHIFAASRQEDLILDYCKRVSLSDRRGRLFMLKVLRPAFVALRWLNKVHFGQSPQIAESIDKLERQVEKLAQLTGKPQFVGDSLDRCPVCQEPSTKPNMYDSTRYCPKCLEVIMPALIRVRSREYGFGTEAI